MPDNSTTVIDFDHPTFDLKKNLIVGPDSLPVLTLADIRRLLAEV
jgi:hypothetical protein